MLIAAVIIIVLIFLVHILFRNETFGKKPSAFEMKNLAKSSFHNGNKFLNKQTISMKIHIIEVWKDYRKSRRIIKKPEFKVPVNKLTREDFKGNPSQKLKVIWLGHVGMLLDLDGLRILVDPVLGLRASPISWAGVKRLHETPLEISEIPEIDILLLSHDHYDHMDMPTLKSFRGKNTKFLVPLGVKATLLQWGILSQNIVEMDWHETFTLNNTQFISIPCQHFSGRRFNNRDKTLWCSWAVKGKHGSFFHSGDTGFFDGYKDIGEKYGPFDLAMIGIGAYNRLWAQIHTFPEEAAKVHEFIRAKQLLPIHWGTFNLAFHSYLEPVMRLLECAKEKEIKLILPEIGERVDIENYRQDGYWWEKA
ncbi:MAG: MBL fold metallo-hydrolase [Bacteroidales bacterium]|nr:MBL fold metallo-hydrolase [Bacteroidales bacterium]